MHKKFKVFISLLLFLFIANVSVGSSTNSKPNSHKQHTLKVTTVPVYRLRSDSNQDHFYTSNQFEIPEYTDDGYRFESIIGEVFTEQQPNTVPLHRLYCPSEKNHYYTIRDNYEKLTTRSYNPYTYEGVVGYVYETEVENSIPLYRLRSDAQKNHFYTTNSKEKDIATKKGYRFERVECYILPSEQNNVQSDPGVAVKPPGDEKKLTSPLYRLRSDSNQDHFYTSNQAEIPAFTDQGYRFESIIGDVFTEQQPNTVPLHRLYCPSEKNHFYTIRDNYDKLVTRSYNPYTYEGIVGYVYETEVDNSIPLYRLRSDAQKNHFYTTNSKEKDNATKKGYRFERIECYILPEVVENQVNDIQDEPVIEKTPSPQTMPTQVEYSGNFVEDEDVRIYQAHNGSITLFDFDNDNDLDLLVTGKHRADLYENDGAGNFEKLPDDFQPVQYGCAVVGDVDGDNYKDIIIASMGNTVLYKNNSDGTFTESSRNFKGLHSTAMAIGDVDGDFDLDFLVCGRTGSLDKETHLYFNNGNGIFAESSQDFKGVSKGSAEMEDVDGDNDLDILLTGNKSVVLYINNGSGVFTEKPSGFPALLVSDSDFADIDSDGDSDLVLIGSTDGDEITRIYLNNGTGNFTDSGQRLINVENGAAKFHDLDLDGDPDLLLSGWDGENGKTILYLNDGSGLFVETEINLPDANQSMADFGDIDNDGDVDIIFGGYRGGTALYRQE